VGLVGAMTLNSTPAEPVLTAGTSAVTSFKTKMATRWSDADDDEDTALPRIPWLPQTAAGSAWPCMHGRVSPPAHLTYAVRVFLPELLSTYRSESVLELQAASRALACRCSS
jgi:hypothetical protein